MGELGGGGRASARDVAEAVRDLPGVVGVRVVRRRGGPDEVRLGAAPGHEPAEVARAVRAALAPAPPDPPQRLPDVLDLTAPPTPPSSTPPTPSDLRVVVDVERPEGTSRLELQRLRVGTEGFGAVAEVVLADGDVLHVGAAETAATLDGTRRALATATAQALESAGAGVLRIEVDGVQVEPVAGRPTVVVALSVVSARGAEHLVGCALADDDPGRAVVAAVLSAANRRIELAMAERAGHR